MSLDNRINRLEQQLGLDGDQQSAERFFAAIKAMSEADFVALESIAKAELEAWMNEQQIPAAPPSDALRVHRKKS